MIKVVAKFRVESEKTEEFKTIADQLITKTRQEEGNIAYKLYQGKDKSQILTFIEEWDDQPALENHKQTEHYQNALPQIGELLISEPEVDIYILIK